MQVQAKDYHSMPVKEEGKHHHNFQCEWPNTPLDGDTFGLSVCSLVRDFYVIQKRKDSRGSPITQYSRLASSIGLLVSCLVIQVFLLGQVKKFVSAKAVHDVRLAYDVFEHKMYGGHTTVIKTIPFVERRGIGGPRGPYFNVSNFELLGEDEKANACRIPLSQPLFFWIVLFIWTLTCVKELRTTRDLFHSLVLNAETAQTMLESLEDEDENQPGGFVIARLTWGVKTLFTCFVIIPRFIITCYLIWIGCRWLLATNNFADLILNSMALEFILALKETLYLALVSKRSMIDLENTHILPFPKVEPESLTVFVGTLGWAFLAAGWVLAYQGFHIGGFQMNGVQQVLIDYQWDVHNVCTDWIAERYAV